MTDLIVQCIILFLGVFCLFVGRSIYKEKNFFASESRRKTLHPDIKKYVERGNTAEDVIIEALKKDKENMRVSGRGALIKTPKKEVTREAVKKLNFSLPKKTSKSGKKPLKRIK